MRFKSVRYRGIDVCYRPELEGGGMGFGQTYVPIVKELWGHVGRVHEFCSGPGFIGFALLAHGLCDSLCLSDVNPEAVEAARETVRRNALGERVSVHLSDALDGIPGDERWDLVVSNPPHFRSAYEGSLRHHDPEWRCHRNLYSGVARYLNPGASLLIQENYEGSEEADFASMIEDGGLSRVGSLTHRGARNSLDSYYFLWSRAGDGVARMPGDGASYAFVSREPEIAPLDLSTQRPLDLRMKAETPYRLRIANASAHEAILFVSALRFGLVPRFLRSLCKVPGQGEIVTYTFQWAPGRYRIWEWATGRTVAHVVAAP